MKELMDWKFWVSVGVVVIAVMWLMNTPKNDTAAKVKKFVNHDPS